MSEETKLLLTGAAYTSSITAQSITIPISALNDSAGLKAPILQKYKQMQSHGTAFTLQTARYSFP